MDRSEHDNEQPTDVPLLIQSDSDIRMCIKEVIDKSNQGGQRIRSLQHVAFAYSPRGPADSTPNLAGSPANILDVVGFVHDGESILDTPMHSWIQDPLVIDQQWIQAP